MKIKSKILIIAGSDSSGGAGIQADIKSVTSLGSYAMTAITAITAQNTTGVKSIIPIPIKEISNQIEFTSKDIKPDSVKIGMLHSTKVINSVLKSIKKSNLKKIILDPVMVAKGGHSLLDIDAIESLKKKLFPLSFLITPNIPEAEKILKSKINNIKDMEENMEKFKSMNIKNILLKGGHLKKSKIADLLQTNKKVYKFTSLKINTLNTHGTGCTMASAIACNLFNGFSLYNSVKNARKYVISGIKKSLIIGSGHNPLNHFL